MADQDDRSIPVHRQCTEWNMYVILLACQRIPPHMNQLAVEYADRDHNPRTLFPNHKHQQVPEIARSTRHHLYLGHISAIPQ